MRYGLLLPQLRPHVVLVLPETRLSFRAFELEVERVGDLDPDVEDGKAARWLLACERHLLASVEGYGLPHEEHRVPNATAHVVVRYGVRLTRHRCRRVDVVEQEETLAVVPVVEEPLPTPQGADDQDARRGEIPRLAAAYDAVLGARLGYGLPHQEGCVPDSPGCVVIRNGMGLIRCRRRSIDVVEQEEAGVIVSVVEKPLPTPQRTDNQDARGGEHIRRSAAYNAVLDSRLGYGLQKLLPCGPESVPTAMV